MICGAQLRAQSVYYVSSTGNDTNTGKSISLPWKTIDKVNSMMSSFVPGDSIVFKCGEVFRGELIITKSGTSNAKIYFGSYGTGAKPVINGASTVTNWITAGTNLWVADYSGTLSFFNNFIINGTSQQIGRFPNVDAAGGGYLTIDSFADSLQLTDEALQGYNFTGGTAVVRVKLFILNEPVIQSHSGSSLNFVPNGTNYHMSNGYGYFIQNHLSTLDKQGEWFYNASTKKIYVYSTTDPDNVTVEAPVKNNGITMNSVSYLTVRNLCFRNSNVCGIRADITNYVTVASCQFDNQHNAVILNSSNNANVSSNSINNTNNNAISITGNFNTCNSNQIINTALRAGMGDPNNNQYNGVNFVGGDGNCERNYISNAGFCGIRFEGSRLTIKNNVISGFALTKADAGGIYSFKGFAPASYGYGNNMITGNIIRNGYPNLQGTSSIPVNTNYAVGIYLDNDSYGNTVTNNTVYNCHSAGLLLNIRSHSHTVRNNLFYNNLFGFACFPTTTASKNFNIKQNTFFSRDSYQVLGLMLADNLLMQKNMGMIDSNYFCNPYEPDSGLVQTNENYATRIHKVYTLNNWRTVFQYDKKSTQVNYKINPYTTIAQGSNLISNGTFTSGISGWVKVPSSGNLSPVWDNTNVLDAGSLKLNVSGVSVPSTSRASFPVGNLSFGKFYQVSFSLKGSTDTARLKVVLSNAFPVAKYKTVKTSSIRKEVTLVFTPVTNVSGVSLMFTLNDTNNQVWIDNVQFKELTTSNANPDNNLFFAVNDQSSSQTITLPSGSFNDVKGNTFSGSILLAPFSANVLMKQGSQLQMQSSADRITPSVISPENTLLFPNPADNEISLIYHSQEKARVDISIYSLNGQKVQQIKTNVANGSQLLKLSISALSPGQYILKIKSKTEERSLPFIKR